MRKLTTALTGAAICVLAAAGCGGGDEGASSTTTSAPESTTTTATSTPAPPVAEAALDGLLLSPAEIDTVVGATGMTVAGTSTSLAEDVTAAPDAPDEVACVGIAGTAEAQAYAGFGSTAVRDQLLQVPGDDGPSLYAAQAVVLFPTAEVAAAFFIESAKRWSACREYDRAGTLTTVGPVSDGDGMLSTSLTIKNENAPDGLCERALTVENNVAIDVYACGGSSDSAITIAEQIAAKVPSL